MTHERESILIHDRYRSDPSGVQPCGFNRADRRIWRGFAGEVAESRGDGLTRACLSENADCVRDRGLTRGLAECFGDGELEERGGDLDVRRRQQVVVPTRHFLDLKVSGDHFAPSEVGEGVVALLRPEE